MGIKQRDIERFVEPVWLFCVKRLSNRHDAEDLSGEIMLHVLDGLDKYPITSLEAWVWRIAHNRYARFIARRAANLAESFGEDIPDIADDYSFIDAFVVKNEHEEVFKALQSLSSEYRNILVDYYLHEISVKGIAARYSLSESTVKWRLNISRSKIKDRIGDRYMNRIYTRINWNTTTCNGAMNSNKYLYSQIARTICEAAYEKPLTVEEISLATGLPALYIEDELPRLIAGDAIVRTGNKNATDFIVLRLKDKKQMDQALAPLMGELTDYFAGLLAENAEMVSRMGFYGADFGMDRLGYMVVPAVIRKKITEIKNSLNMPDGNFPPRKDGGYGWFIVEETETDDERAGAFNSGCNTTDETNDDIYYYWINKYFDVDIYHNGGTRWLAAKKIPQQTAAGFIPEGLLDENDLIRLLRVNLIHKSGDSFKKNFPQFKQEEYQNFVAVFNKADERIDALLAGVIRQMHHNFKMFVPKRLDGQINQWVSCYIHSIAGLVCEQLIERGVLQKPESDKPLTNGVFFVEGSYVNP